MEVFIKIPSRAYDLLRSRLPADSSAREAAEKATRIDYSVGGVLFEGYSISCDQQEARLLRDIASRCCPDIVPRIDEAISGGERSRPFPT